ncbi:MAG: DUF2490 domain-containing protein [Ferruginibacter sp.]
MKKYFLILVIASFSLSAFSQSSETGNWFIYFGNQAINKRWSWWNEVQYRNYNAVGDLEQLLIRTGIAYNLTQNNNQVLMGYGFIRSENYATPNYKVGFNEHRLYQQFITRQQFGRVFLQHRYRIEERFLPDDIRVRFRYFLGVNVPVNKKTMSKNAWYLSAYNEVFLNAEQPVFDRNRLYGAIGYVFNKNWRAEAGFMRQMRAQNSRNQFQLVVFNSLPLFK